MKKSRTLVLGLALFSGLLGANAGPPGASPAPLGAQAPSAVAEIAAAPATAADITGSGTRWKRWACFTCFGVGLAITNSPLAIVGGLVLAGCAAACF